MPRLPKNQIDDLLLLALACGASYDAAASKAGTSVTTVKRRLQDPVFRARLRELRGEMFQRATSMLTASAVEAVRTLVDLMKHESPHATRLGAARAVLELGVRLRETAELQDRIARLETELGAGA
ncbi:hypothetical protein [Zavarzinella formosa]|uniref:hypothetical protein n=1 Tax=Zavarzinella formosa TaxID=360055 RepID=UPI0003083FB9|nr:hypothetical protein [Zavarzinella formosa]